MSSPFPEGSTRACGHKAESFAAGFLEAKGMEICARNVHIAGAELDLVVRLPGQQNSPIDTYLFVEVRSREDDQLGSPLETILPQKKLG